eukprot:m.871685 g.871685  ORF g.871685 m.871685 type:complete len:107 (+) comp23568_c0_seq54:2007-2327(+)
MGWVDLSMYSSKSIQRASSISSDGWGVCTLALAPTQRRGRRGQHPCSINITHTDKHHWSVALGLIQPIGSAISASGSSQPCMLLSSVHPWSQLNGDTSGLMLRFAY